MPEISLSDLIDSLTRKPDDLCPAAFAITMAQLDGTIQLLETANPFMAGMAIGVLKGERDRLVKVWEDHAKTPMPEIPSIGQLHEILSEHDEQYQCGQWKAQQKIRQLMN